MLASRARGGAAALVVLAGFFLSCSQIGVGPSAGRLAPAAEATYAAAATGSSQAPAPRVEPADTIELVGLQDRFESVVRRVSPAVVAISSIESADIAADQELHAERINPDKLSRILDASDRTVGTGLIVDPDGYIVTNDHVVARGRHLWVTTDDRRVYPAIVVGSDPRADLAVLKIPARNLPTVRFADGEARRGMWTIAVGNPYGLGTDGNFCVSVGVVSAVGKSLPKLSGKEDRLYSNLIQTTAQINPGNSGGPLFNLAGEVIGVNTAVILPQKQTNGIGFAIPTNERFHRIVAQIKQGREVVYGYLGVTASTPTARERREAGVDGDIGAHVDTVASDSPAAEVKIGRGDVVTELNGETIRDGDHFVRAIGACPVGEPVRAVVYSNGKSRTVELQLKRREVAAKPVTRESQRFRWRGMLLGPIPEHWTFTGPRPESGVMVIGVESDSAAARERGITAGTVITSIGGNLVRDLEGLQKVLHEMPPENWSIELAGRGETALTASH